jgi:hypothetical protein
MRNKTIAVILIAAESDCDGHSISKASLLGSREIKEDKK